MPSTVRTDTADPAVVPPSSFGCAVVVGGVGLWPGLAQPLAERVRVARPAMHVEPIDLLDAAGRSADPLFADLVAALRDRVEALPGPVTIVAEWLEAAVVLAVALDPPASLGAIVLHEPLVTAADPALGRVLRAAADRFRDEDDPTVGVERFTTLLAGSDTWRRLPEPARGYLRHRASTLRRVVPSLVAWEPTGVRPDVTAIVTVGRASNAMHHRAARAISKDRGRHVVAGPGHLASLEAPAALADITLIATDAAHARFRAREAGHPSSRFVA